MALSTFAAGRLWGTRYGAGRPWVLALPGWGHDHRDFDPVLEGLDAIALDLPGFGVAQEPPAAWSTAEYASFVNPVLDDMTGGPLVVLGHSFGARVAVHLAAGTAPAGTAPAGTAPAGTAPAGTAPAGTAPAGTAPAGTAPKAAAPTGGVVGPSGTGRVATLILTGAPLAPAPGKRPSGPAPVYRVGRALHRVGLLSGRQMEGLRRKYGSDDYRRASDVMRGVLVKAVGETASGAYAGKHLPVRIGIRRNQTGAPVRHIHRAIRAFGFQVPAFSRATRGGSQPGVRSICRPRRKPARS